MKSVYSVGTILIHFSSEPTPNIWGFGHYHAGQSLPSTITVPQFYCARQKVGQCEEEAHCGFGLSLHEKTSFVLQSWEMVCVTSLRVFPFPCRLSHQEKEQISAQIAALKDTYQALCSDSTEQLQQLQSQLAQEAEHKVLVPARPGGRTAQGPPQGVSTVVLGCVSHGHSCPSAFLLACGCLPSLLSMT